MSRPFSYNDENFTVIGNLLFIHFRDDKSRVSGEAVLQIPPGIYERMVTNSFNFLVQLVGAGQSASSIYGYTIKIDGEYFISFLSDIGESIAPRYYIGFSQLKDI